MLLTTGKLIYAITGLKYLHALIYCIVMCGSYFFTGVSYARTIKEHSHKIGQAFKIHIDML